MIIGVPKGLLYYKYGVFVEKFFNELGCKVVTSPRTNKEILNLGTSCSVDEACVPIKVFHGHVAYLKDKCDMIVIPRIMTLSDREYICPKFCGLPEMIKNSIQGIPKITEEPIYAKDMASLYKSMLKIGHKVNKNRSMIKSAFLKALDLQRDYKTGFEDVSYEFKLALLGHPYNVQDEFLNMNIKNKLNKLGFGVVTEEFVPDEEIKKYAKELLKKPFWTFFRRSYGSSRYFVENNKINGIVYISSFNCGIDSVVIELIKDKIGDFPFLVLKIDEQTGQGGFDTRVEAFTDMIERRIEYENNFSSLRKHIHCS
ncbi:acyl-CoA dehydratase activase-related protein [Haloimpatiens sp. FM7315]|uniref:acyl-CoA dehydratase activase-related protein n=1 Tax=Haloimpatiens sp. FM7315 TaxID=3298609 RepID=UPI00370AFEB5